MKLARIYIVKGYYEVYVGDGVSDAEIEKECMEYVKIREGIEEPLKSKDKYIVKIVEGETK